MPLPIVVYAVNQHDSKTAFEIVEPLKYRFERMKKIYADGGYRGELAENVKKKFGWDMEITLR
ncbi:MAG: DDE transposase, partial [Prevotellaceae bacterium]|nr:DDE transposase [Prevotellaceae bacterium]